ncbi:hypothetical protein HK100_005543 [Physocladia obscura]|uniref:Uncharacterized protein n=1 Tax=Physocladia obscura TaxID=109957 RepID=A0AAD5T6G2_9FUNG|nr:hypothetical protein HK100_005543 [Physocladia obscura]
MSLNASCDTSCNPGLVCNLAIPNNAICVQPVWEGLSSPCNLTHACEVACNLPYLHVCDPKLTNGSSSYVCDNTLAMPVCISLFSKPPGAACMLDYECQQITKYSSCLNGICVSDAAKSITSSVLLAIGAVAVSFFLI